MTKLHIPSEIQNVIDNDGVIFVSHSGGKDSQAMYNLVLDVVPVERICIVHADLGRVEWDGVQDHINATIGDFDLNVVHSIDKNGDEIDLIGMIDRRRATLDAQGKHDAPAFPSSAARFCTSDLKTGPIAKFMRAEMKRRGTLFGVNAMGIRAEESPARAKKQALKINGKMSKAGRTVYDWMPIFDLTTVEVFEVIAEHGQAPFWAYEQNERLSCVFCIFGSANDLAHGAKQRPELLAEYVDLEKRTRTTMFHKQSLLEKIAVVVE